MDYLGIEPRTARLKADYSTVELVIQLKQIFFSGLTGFEPATSIVTGWYSNQLSYNPIDREFLKREGFEPSI